MTFYSRSDLRTFYEKFKRDRLLDHASSLTFTTILSLIPMLAMAYAFFTLLGGFDKYEGQFEDFVSANLAPAFGDKVMDYVYSIQDLISPNALGIFGILGFVVTSIAMLQKAEDAFNVIWGTTKKRPFMRRLTGFWTLISMGPILIGASLVISQTAYTWLKSDSGDIATVLVFLAQYLGPYALTVALFFTLYQMLPNAKIHRKDALQAAALTGVIFEAAKKAYAVYATHSLQHSVYGSLAILPIFFLWLYWVWMITLLGFEYCCYLESRRMGWIYKVDEDQTLDTLLLFDMMEALAHYQIDGRGAGLDDLVRTLKVSRGKALGHLEFLKAQGVIVESDQEKPEEHTYHLAYGRDSINHRRLLEAIEKSRFQPVGSVTRSLAQKQFELFSKWSLHQSPAKGGPVLTEVPTSRSEN